MTKEKRSRVEKSGEAEPAKGEKAQDGKQRMQLLGPLTRKKNRQRIILYYFAAVVFFILGLWKQENVYHAVAVAFLLLALIRKFIIMPKLKA